MMKTSQPARQTKNISFLFLLIFLLYLSKYANAAPPPAYEYYKGGDGTSNWKVMDRTVPVIPPAADPFGATISEVFDGGKGHNVLNLNGDGINNSYRLTTFGDPATYDCDPLSKFEANRAGCIDNDAQKELKIEIKASGMFYIYLYIDTPEDVFYTSQSRSYNQYNGGLRVLEFTPTNVAASSTNWTDPERRYYSWGYRDYYSSSTLDLATESWTAGETYHFGLGADKMDGTWHTITIDFLEEARKLEPGIDEAKLRGLEIRGDARIDEVSLGWRNEELDLYENFDPDPDWAYDTGWLDMHGFGENSSGRVDCMAESGKYELDCTTLDEAVPSCKSIIGDKKAVIDIDLSDLPQPQMDDCYFMFMADYTWKDSLKEGVQDYEDLLVEVDAGGISTSALILDPGEGPHKVVTTEPLTLIRGVNRAEFKSPGFCTHGHSIHFGYGTRSGMNPFGFEYKGNKTFRIQCGAGPNALDLSMYASPAIIAPGNTSTVHWTSQNAKTCNPLGGYFDLVDNDWQNMALTWSDLQTGNPLWPSYTTSFLTNSLNESVNYTLNCNNISNDRYITRSAKVSVLSTCYNNVPCNDFVWDRVRSRNDAGDHYKYNDPADHPTNIKNAGVDASGNPIPVADSDVAFEPVYNLSAGAHRIDVKAREDGVYIDKLIITNDMNYIPADNNDGFGTNPVAGGKVKIDLESENFNHRGSSWTIYETSNYTASGTKSMYVRYYDYHQPYGSYIFSSSSYYYYIGYDFNVPVADNYTVWGRFSSKAAVNDDSVWLTIDSSLSSSGHPNDKYDCVLWDIPTVVHGCCVEFDFAAIDPSTGLRSNSIAVNVPDPFDLVWASGNLHSVLPSMGAGNYDDQWVGFAYNPKDSSEVPLVPDPPGPIYHSQTMDTSTLANGIYVYELQGLYGSGDYTEKKTVTVNVGAAVPPDVDGICGDACHHNSCMEPTSGFCTSPSTLQDPPGLVPDPDGWSWTCEGTGTGNPTDCRAERNCGWVER